MPKSKNNFSFRNATVREMIDYLNEKYPITLKYNDELVARIQERYPSMKKMDVAFIVRAVFICMRENVMQGKVLQIGSLFRRLYLFFWIENKRNNKAAPKVRLNMTTPPNLKNKDIIS